MKALAQKPDQYAVKLPLDVRWTVGHSYVVQDAAGKVVSQEYWKKHHAETAAERLTRAARVKTRACLCCRKSFESEGPHHRMCGTCRNDRSEGAQEVRPYVTRGSR